jgi:hypothetical protein
MPPDFSKKTIDTLAKRAAFLCSNPDCRVSTVGPNSESAEATIIGEAAHIFAARADQPRYEAHMTDQARSEISNAIWLCRNCHKQADRDPLKFPADLLFVWRESHEEYVASNLGTQTEKARFEIARHALAPFDGYPPLIRRIAYDKPPGWEWSLSAALMQHLNAPLFRKLVDLRDGVSALQITFLDDDKVLGWVSERTQEMAEIIEPLTKILERFNSSWGEPGQPGDIDEIHHTALLLRDSLAQIVSHEERLQSVRVSEKFDEVVVLLKDALGSQAEKFKRLPDRLDEIVAMAINMKDNGPSSEPVWVHEVIEFNLPDGWADDVSGALRRLKTRSIIGEFARGVKDSESNKFGCVSWFVLALFIVVLIQLL